MMTDAERSAAFRAEFRKRQDAEERRERRGDVEELAAQLLVSIFGTDDEWREEDGPLVAKRAFIIAEAFIAERDRRRS
jgi:hypothetical protein